MLLRSGRSGCLLALLILSLLWATRNGIPIVFQPPDWRIYTVDIAEIYSSSNLNSSAISYDPSLIRQTLHLQAIYHQVAQRLHESL